MKNKKFLLAIPAIALVFAMTVVGCDNDSTDDNSGGTGSGGGLTVTDIPSQYNGKYGLFSGSSSTASQIGQIMGAKSINWLSDSMVLDKIANGSITIPGWILKQTGDGTVRYSGSETVQLGFMVYDTIPDLSLVGAIAGVSFTSVTFTKGSAKVSWNNGTQQ